MKNVLEFEDRKNKGQKISMVTCYDAWSARLIDHSQVDVVLVGDSAAMVMHGFSTTLNATVELMATHVEAVKRNLKEKFLIADMPFMSFRKGRAATLEAVEVLIRAGAHAVKIEGVRGHEDVIEATVNSGVPVMGHLGLTPQSVNQFGGYRVQGRDQVDFDRIFEEAIILDKLGCFSIVLECVPMLLAKKITEKIKAATIGIGAGPFVDGQVLVLHDLLGCNSSFQPRFVRKYADLEEVVLTALNRYHQDVTAVSFPGREESFE